jgi:hypothetical protein
MAPTARVGFAVATGILSRSRKDGNERPIALRKVCYAVDVLFPFLARAAKGEA